MLNRGGEIGEPIWSKGVALAFAFRAFRQPLRWNLAKIPG